jgi:hypothetical protein
MLIKNDQDTQKHTQLDPFPTPCGRDPLADLKPSSRGSRDNSTNFPIKQPIGWPMAASLAGSERVRRHPCHCDCSISAMNGRLLPQSRRLKGLGPQWWRSRPITYDGRPSCSASVVYAALSLAREVMSVIFWNWVKISAWLWAR